MSLMRGSTTKAVHWPEMQLPAWEPLSSRAVRYLKKRGISEQQAAEFGIVEMEHRMRVVVPFHGPSGEIIYWTARSYSSMEDGPKYLGAGGKHPLYVLPNWNKHEPLVLVEGVFDAISIYLDTKMAVAGLGGKAMGRYLHCDVLNLSQRTIVVVLDGDAVGDAMAIKRHLSTANRDVRLKVLDLGQDPSNASADLLRRLLL